MKSINEFIEDLKRQGYSVKFDASTRGSSGVVHHVDLLAEHPNGKKIVGLEMTRGKKAALEIIKTFAIAYDTGAEACYVIYEELDDEEEMPCSRTAFP